MKTSWKERLLSAVATSALVLGLVPAGAIAEGAHSLDTDAEAAGGPGYSLSVGGLMQGDAVKYYKIIEQDVDTVDDKGTEDTSDDVVTKVGTQAWKLTDAVDANHDGKVDGSGYTVADFIITDYDEEDGVVTSDTRQLTAAMANAVAVAVTNNKANPVADDLSAGADGKVTVANASSGMYMFVAVPGDNNVNYIYKPVFVSADYYNSVEANKPEDNTHALVLEENETAYLEEEEQAGGFFKKSPLSIDKKSGTDADWQNDVAVGDTVEFTITVPIPSYTKNYVAPMFYITDSLTEGLKLNPGTIQVSVEGFDVVKDEDYAIYTRTFAGTNENITEGYHGFKNTLAEDSSFEGFVVQFLNDNPAEEGSHDGFLYTVLGAPNATITYTATVTETAKQHFAQQVNQMDNTAKLTYSNDPNYIPDGYFKKVQEPDPDNPGEFIEVEEPDPDFPTNNPDTKDENDNPEDNGELEDKTRHYTFDIDADVLGPNQTPTNSETGEPDYTNEEDENRTSEIRKTWIEPNGKVIQTETTSKVVKDREFAEGRDDEEATYSWLEGAEFSLTRIQKCVVTGDNPDEEGKINGTMAELGDGDYTEVKFDSTSHIRVTEGGSNPVSDGKGYIAMKGLDAGVYILKETKAPLGYAFNPNIQYQITITPTYVFEAADADDGSAPQNGTGGADDLILESYKVEIVTQKLGPNLEILDEEPVTTISIYNIAQDNGTPKSILDENGAQDPTVTIDTTVQSFGDNKTALVVNQRLGILPATGGSGILFYLFVGGAVAAVALILIKKVKQAGAAAA